MSIECKFRSCTYPSVNIGIFAFFTFFAGFYLYVICSLTRFAITVKYLSTGLCVISIKAVACTRKTIFYSINYFTILKCLAFRSACSIVSILIKCHSSIRYRFNVPIFTDGIFINFYIFTICWMKEFTIPNTCIYIFAF